MVHTVSGFRGTRVGVTEGAGPRHQSEDLHGESLPRIRVTYWCASVECQAPADKKKAAANGGRKVGAKAKRSSNAESSKA